MFLHQKEETIQRQWQQMAMANNDADSLCTDGLLFRGKIRYEDGCWHRDKGDEEALWQQSKRRLMILTKDLNDDEGWDIRQETGRYNEVAFSYERALSFYKNLRMWSYLLLKGRVGNMPSFDEARDMDISGPFYENAPIVRINCKKQVGGESIADSTLMKYLETYAQPLKSQMALYGANIWLCCGCSCDKNIILDFVRAQLMPDLQVIPGSGDWMYYSPSAAALVINSYHPSARIGYQDTYYNLSDAFSTALTHLSTHSLPL